MNLAAFSQEFFRNAGRDLILALTSMIPVVELRGAIPLGIVLKAKWYQTFLWTATGNFLPIPFVLKNGDSMLEFLQRNKMINRMLKKLHTFMEQRSESFKKNAPLTLILIIAMPFTGVGAWGASLMASLLRLNKKHSLMAIVVGILISGIMTTLCTYGILKTVLFFL